MSAFVLFRENVLGDGFAPNWLFLEEELPLGLFEQPLRKGAILSRCGLYRYALWRIWDASRPPLVFVMLNPSVADAALDDPTIRRCGAFAQREGRGGIVVVNLYAFRASNPAALKAAADPHGPDNDAALRLVAALAASPIVCAWGAHEMAGEDAIGRALAAISRPGLTLACLGLTASGAPRHPLFVKASQPMLSFAPARNPILGSPLPASGFSVAEAEG